jgi:16S rRNA (guanine(966)-N(2))-methyltransferase RsmD
MFVESDQRAAAVIDQNIKTLGMTGATLRRGTVASVLAAGAETAVDLVFADPPYDMGGAEVNEVLTALTARGWTADGSVVVVERAASGPELTWPPEWQPWRARRYGDTRLEMAVLDVAASAAP